jgi:hypothetical protein
MEDTVVTFEESSDEMEAADLEGNPGATEAVAERQEHRIEEANINNMGS